MTLLENRRQSFAGKLEDLLSNPEASGFLRDYQRETLDATCSHFGEAGETSGSLELPTGSGKTELIFALLDAAMKDFDPKKPPRIFVLEPTRRLIRDTRARLEEHAPDMPFGVYYSGKKDLEQPVTLITYDSFRQLVNSGVIKPEETDLLLMDEAHRGVSDLRSEITDRFRDRSLMLGFTATSGFNEVKDVYRTLGAQIHQIKDQRLIDAGRLCPRANIIAEITPDVPKGDEPTSKDFDNAYTEHAVDLYLGYRDDQTENEPILGQQGLVYTRSVDQAKQIARHFNENPKVVESLRRITGNPNIIPATYVSGEMSDAELDRHFADYRAGKTHILCGDKIFIEGIDLPKTSWILRRAGTSSVDTIQAGGRVTRIDKDNPGKTGRIIEVVMTGEKNKPKFYSELIGQPRMGRIKVGDGILRHQLPDNVTTTPLPSSIKLYNSPFSVEQLIAEKKRPAPGESQFLGARFMAKQLEAWPQEVDRIYQVLKSQYNRTSNETPYLSVAGYRVPRNFAVMYPDKNGELLLRRQAEAIIADIVSPIVEASESYLTREEAIERELTPARKERIAQFYDETARLYTEQFLNHRYDRAGGSSELTPLNSMGFTIPMESVAMLRGENGPVLAIHENTLRRLWHPAREERQPVERTVAEFAKHLNVAQQNPRFREVWDELRHRYNLSPRSTIAMDGAEIKAAYRKTPQPRFLISSEHEDWFRSKVGRSLGVRTEEWLPKQQFFAAMRYDTGYSDHRELWQRIRNQYDAAPLDPVVIDGHTVQCGYALSGLKTVFCLHMDEKAWFDAKANELIHAKTSEWLGRNDLSERLRVYYNNPDFQSLLSKLEARYHASPESPVVMDGETIRCGMIQKHHTRSFGVHASAVPWFRQQLKIDVPFKTPDCLTKIETAQRLHIAPSNPVFSAAWDELETTNFKTGSTEIPFDDGVVHCGRRIFAPDAWRQVVSFYVTVDGIPALAKRLGRDIPMKESHWSSLTEASALAHVSLDDAALRSLWADLIRRADEHPGAPIVIDGHTVRCGYRNSHGKIGLYIDDREIDWLRKEIDARREFSPRTPDWMNKTRWVAELGVASQNPHFHALWESIAQAYDAHPEKPSVNGHVIKLGMKLAPSGHPVFCVHQSEKPWLESMMEKSIGLSVREEAWLSKGDAASRLKTTRAYPEFAELWASMEHASDTQHGNQSILLDGRKIKFGKFLSTSKTQIAYYLHEDEIEGLQQRLNRDRPARTEDWLPIVAFAKILNVGRYHKGFVTLWEEALAQSSQHPDTPVVIDGHVLQSSFRYGGKGHPNLFCIHASEADWIRQKIGIDQPPLTTDSLDKTKVVTRLHTTLQHPAFIEIWERLIQEHEKNPAAPVIVDGEKIDCGYCRSVTGKLVFCLDQSALSWFSMKMDEVVRQQNTAQALPGQSSEKDAAPQPVTDSSRSSAFSTINRPPECKTKLDFAALLSTSVTNPSFMDLWEKIEIAHQKAKGAAVVIDDHTVNCDYYRSGAKTSFAVHEAEAPWFEQKLGLLPKKTEEWLAKGDLHPKVGVRFDNARFLALIDRIKAEYDAHPEDPVSVDGHIVKCSMRRAQGKPVFCLHENEVEWMKEKIGNNIPPKTSEWVDSAAFAFLIGTAPTSDGYKKFIEEVRQRYASNPNAPIVMNDHALRFEKRLTSNGQQPLCFHEDEKEWVRTQLRLNVPEKPEGMLPKTLFARAANVFLQSKAFEALWEQIKSEHDLFPEEPVIIDDHKVRCGTFKSGNARTFFIHEEEADWFKARCKNQMNAGAGSSKGWKRG